MYCFRVIDNLPVATKFVLDNGQVRDIASKVLNLLLAFPTLYRSIFNLFAVGAVCILFIFFLHN